jgi:tetratricopeptide (TPR) repeat protein
MRRYLSLLFNAPLHVKVASLLCLWFGCGFLWQCLDNMPFWEDPVFYAEGAIHVIRNLQTLPFPEFLRSLNDITGMQTRPPGASLLLAPFVYGCHYDTQLIKLALLIWYIPIFASIYYVGTRFFNPETGLLAMVFFMCLPQVYFLEIHPEKYQLFLLPLTLVCCHAIFQEGKAAYLGCFVLGVCTACALLLKWIFAIFLLGPMVYLCIIIFTRKDAPSWHKLALKIALMLLPVLSVFLFWYLPNWTQLTETFHSNAITKAFTPYKDGWDWSVPFYYPFQFLWFNKLIPSLLLLAGLTLLISPAKIRRLFMLESKDPAKRFGAHLLFASLIGFLIYFALRYDNIPKKYMFPMLSILSIMAVCWIPSLKQQRLKTWLINAMLLYGFFCTFWIHFGVPSLNAIAISPRNFYMNPDRVALWYTVPNAWIPDRNQWPMKAIAASLKRWEGENQSPREMCVLTDIYYVDWFSVRYEILKSAPTVDTRPLSEGKGLENLVNADYILTSRNSLTRFPYHQLEKDIQAKSALPLGRWIDRCPPWLASHFRLVDKFQLPCGYGEMQLYQRTQPHDPDSLEQLYEFWLTYNLESDSVWPQIAACCHFASQPERGRIAFLFNQAKQGNQDEAWNELKFLSDANRLLPYEKFQLGVWALQRGNTEEQRGIDMLNESIATNRSFNWLAACILGRWFQEKNNPDLAEQYYLTAWKKNRERPEALTGLLELARQSGDAQQIDFYQNLEQSTAHLLRLNRSELACNRIITLLTECQWWEDALDYAHRLYRVGKRQYPTLHTYHTLLRKNGKSIPDYETLLLPTHDTPRTLESPPLSYTVQPEQKTIAFPFLNLREGDYHLTWEHNLSQATSIHLTLDETDLGTLHLENESPGEFTFTSPGHYDLLTLHIQQGKGIMSNFRLQRTTLPIPMINEEGEIIPENSQLPAIKYGDKGYQFQTQNNQVQFEFPVYTDLRAWDTLQFGQDNMAGGQVTVNFDIYGEDEKRQTFSWTHQLQSDEKTIQIQIPDKVKDSVFLENISLVFENLPAAKTRTIRDIQLVRDQTRH